MTSLKKRIEKDGFQLVDLINLGERECTRLYGKVALRKINEALDEEGLPQVGEATLNFWPSSQICMDCEHGEFINTERVPASTYTCSKAVDLGPCASSCPFFENQGEEE
jgi:hypothetical protein